MEKFLKRLIDTRYLYTNEDNNEDYVSSNLAPFYANDGPLPPIVLIKELGVNCAGLCNLCRKYNNLSIPTYNTFYGGTESYFTFFKKEEIDYQKNYPNLTLLLYDYNPIDQGHVAIVFDDTEKPLKDQKIIHSKGWKDFKVVHEILSDDPININKYTHIVSPKEWLE